MGKALHVGTAALGKRNQPSRSSGGRFRPYGGAGATPIWANIFQLQGPAMCLAPPARRCVRGDVSGTQREWHLRLECCSSFR